MQVFNQLLEEEQADYATKTIANNIPYKKKSLIKIVTNKIKHDMYTRKKMVNAAYIITDKKEVQEKNYQELLEINLK